MTDTEKLEMVKAVLDITNTAEDANLVAYLSLAKNEILSWRFSYGISEVTEVPPEYETTQVFAVVAGYSQRGAENQRQHSENGIGRTFRFSDMVQYIRANVIPLVKVIG